MGRRGAADFNRGESSFCSLLQRISRSSVRTGVFLEQPGCKWVAHGSTKRGIGEKKFRESLVPWTLSSGIAPKRASAKPGIGLELSWNYPGMILEMTGNGPGIGPKTGIVLELSWNGPGMRLERDWKKPAVSTGRDQNLEGETAGTWPGIGLEWVRQGQNRNRERSKNNLRGGARTWKVTRVD